MRGRILLTSLSVFTTSTTIHSLVEQSPPHHCLHLRHQESSSPSSSSVMEGYLHKRGRGKSISIYKPYARRYFVLDALSQDLSYYADESRKSHRGKVNVKDSKVIELSKATTGKSFCFDLVCSPGCRDEEVITLAAPTDSQLVEWITKIEEIGNASVTWNAERIRALDVLDEQKRQREKKSGEIDVEEMAKEKNQAEMDNDTNKNVDNYENEDVVERIKTGTILVYKGENVPSQGDWTECMASLSYDFKELSLSYRDGSIMDTIELADATATEIAGVNISAKYILQVDFKKNDTSQCYTFMLALDTPKLRDEWKRELAECGCQCNEDSRNLATSSHIASCLNNDYSSEINDIDDDIDFDKVESYGSENTISFDEVTDSNDGKHRMDNENEDDRVDENQDSGQFAAAAMENNERVDEPVPSLAGENATDSKDSSFYVSDDEDDDLDSRSFDRQAQSPKQSSLSYHAHPRAYLFGLLDRKKCGAITLTEFMVGLRRHEEVAKAMELPSHSRHDDGSRDRCIAAFRKMDEKGSGSVDIASFLKYVDALEFKKKQTEQLFADPAAYFANSSEELQNKERSHSTPGRDNSPSAVKGSTRSSFYSKIARRLEGEMAEKRRLSEAVSPEKLSKLRERISELNSDVNGITTAEDVDHLEMFREKNGMNESPSSSAELKTLTRSGVSLIFDDNGDNNEGSTSAPSPKVSIEGRAHSHSVLEGLKFRVEDISHGSAKSVRMRHQLLRELFQGDVTRKVSFEAAKQFFSDITDISVPLPDMFPFLVEGPCSWTECNQYLRHYEHQMSNDGADVKIKFEISLPVSGYSCKISCALSNWHRRAAKKIQSLPLADINSLPLESIEAEVQKHVISFTSQCIDKILAEMISAEKYVHFLEEFTQCYSKVEEGGDNSPNRSYDNLQDGLFDSADSNHDGKISRSEWRRLMSEREEIIRTANADKERLIEENNRLRRAFYPESEFSYDRLQFTDAKLVNCERALFLKEEEIERLKQELQSHQQQISDMERFTDMDLYHDYRSKKMNRSKPLPSSVPLEGDSSVPFVDDRDVQQESYELPQNEEENFQMSPETIEVPDYYGEYEAQNRERYVERLLSSPLYGPDGSSWAKKEKKKLSVSQEELAVPPSLNQSSSQHHGRVSKNKASHNVRVPSPQRNNQHPLRKAFQSNAKALDLRPISYSPSNIGAHSPRIRSPHKSFKDPTSSSRGKQLPEHVSMLPGVRNPGVWSNSQANKEYE